MIQNSDVIVSSLYMRAQKIIKEAQVLFLCSSYDPRLLGIYGYRGEMQDKTGGDLEQIL